MATSKEIHQAVSKLVKAYALFKPDPEAFRAFMEIVIEKMQPFSILIIESSVNEIIENEKFFPQISEMMAYCWRIRDREMGKLNNKLQRYKDDWLTDDIHSTEEWDLLIDDYKKLNAAKSAEYARECYQSYGKKSERVSAEKVRESVRKMREMAEAKKFVEDA